MTRDCRPSGRPQVELDGYSDPRHESKYSAHDLITMGFVNTPHLAGLLDNTVPLASVKVADYDALVVCGGQSPMFTFRDNKALQACSICQLPTF